MTTATIAPAAAASAAASKPTPELIPHEWSGDGICLNPERVVIDFGGKRGKRTAVILLGAEPSGGWTYGHEVTLKTGATKTYACGLRNPPHEDRASALKAALVEVGSCFNHANDKQGAAAVAGYYDQHFAAPSKSSPANKVPAPAFAPLPKGRFAELKVTSIFPSPENARKVFDPIAEQELAESIRQYGLLQPIAVRRLTPAEMADFGNLPMAGAELYEIILGERRWRAHRRLELETIDCKVYEGVARAHAKAAALVENLQRVDLNPIEEAEGFRDLMAAEQLTQEQCAQRVGRSRPVVANALRVLELPASVVDLIRAGKLSLAHGVALARFKAWPKVVEAVARIAAKEQAPASQLEKGLPFASDLVGDGVVARIEYYKFNHELPADLKKHAAFCKDGDYSHYFLEPSVYEQALKAHEAEKRAAEEAAREKERKKVEAAAKNPAKIKNLAELPRNSFAEVSDESQSLLALVPDEAVRDVKGYDNEKVTICTKPDLFRKIESEVAELKKADRLAKLPPLLDKARERIAKTKKIGPRELTLLILLAQANDEDHIGFTALAAKRQGVKLPAAFTANSYSHLEIGGGGLALIGKEDPVALYRVLADECLTLAIAEDPWDKPELANFDQEPDGAAGALLKHVLELDDLGLLEETKAGQKQLIETVKTAGWYQKAIAAIEAEESKPAKKGGK